MYYWWKPVTDWQVSDLSKVTGRRIYSDPEGWETTSGGQIVEHLAAQGDDYSLLVFWFHSDVRHEGLVTERWASIGPRNITCVILPLAVHPTNADVLYAGAEFGGVWKTTNGGASWRPTMDHEINPCVSALALSRSHPTMIYAGMSPGRLGPGGVGGTGVTLYRSDSSGATWVARAPVASLFCRALALHPADANILYFAGNQGLHKTVDGGATWTDVRNGDIDDVKVDVDMPDIVYASVRGSGIFRSSDGGVTWTQKGAGVAFKVLNDNGEEQNARLNGSFRTLLAIGEDRRAGKHGTRFLVAKVQGTVVISTDGGDTWRVLPGLDHGYDGQNWWTSCIAVCPTDEDFIVAGGARMQFTLNASALNPTWQNIPNDLHEDQQAIAFTPSNPHDFYFSNDGYVGISRNRGANANKVSDGLVACQCFNVAVSEGTTLVAGCSTYHTGTVRTGRTAFFEWDDIDGPEGGLFEIHPTDAATMFGSPWGQSRLRRSTDGGNSWSSLTLTIDDDTETYIQMLAISPDDPSRIYASGFFGRLHYSTDGGDEWAVVMMAPGVPLLPDAGSARGDGDFSFAYAPSNSAYVYVGTKDGHLWRTTTGAISGSGWAELNPPHPLGTGRIAAMAVAPNSPDVVIVGYQIANARVLYRGTRQPNGTFQWTDIGGAVPASSLPLVPVNALMIDPVNAQRIFAATNVGVFVTADGGIVWRPFMEGLPRIRIVDMQLRLQSRMLYVAAYGRGIFRRRI